MKKLASRLLILYFGLFISTAFAADVNWFGPEQYIRTKGKPDVYTDSFQARSGMAKIFVTNGDEYGKNRISSAVITLNGTKIFSPRDFNRHVSNLSADIHLETENTLKVKLKGRSGAHFKPNHKKPHPKKYKNFINWLKKLLSKCGFEFHHKPKILDGPYLTITITQDVLLPTASLSVNPQTIIFGQSTTLHWNCADADSCAIAPGIGQVDLNGSLEISPTETVSYTLTATSVAGSSVSSAKVTVNHPPTAQILSDPQDVTLGQSATLTWNTTHAESVNIEPGIGTVESNGSIQVTPDQSTTYTITAVGVDGMTVTDATTAIVQIPVPTVSFSASSNTIISGQSLTLSWSTTHADSCSITPTVGSVPVNGSTTVSPTQDTTYIITANGPGGTASASVQVSFLGALSVQITSPTQGQHFTTDTITVTGTVNRTNASVFVSGVAATMIDGEYTAQNISLVPGTNTISVLAEDGTHTAVAGITVLLDTTVDLKPIHIDLDSTSNNDGSLKTAGQVMVTVVNNGGNSVSMPYQVVVFEDSNLSGGYEEAEDNRLGEMDVASGPGAGQSSNLVIDFSGQLQFRDNRLHVLVDSADDVQEFDEANNSITSQAGGTDLSASLLVVDDTACPDGIDLTVRIGNAGDASAPAGIPVAFYEGEPGIGGTLIGVYSTTQLLEPGSYQDLTLDWPNPPTGMQPVYIQADDDGTGTGTLSETDEENNRVVSTLTICTASVAQPNGISGRVIDAVTGDIISSASVSLYQEENGLTGALILQSVTDEYGGYLFSDLIPGDYFLVAELTGYIAAQKSVALAVNEALAHQDLVLSPELGAGELSIVLTWGKAPADLEAHLTAPNPDGCRHHCYYWDKAIPGASLDVDDMDAYGPETITISQLNAGIYRFYVHDFSNRLSGSSTALSTSGATVTVYSGDADAPQVFTVPVGVGNVWHVFNLDGTSGTITPIDKMTHQDQPGNVDFPRITSFPATNATYKETYIYQVEAEDPDQDILTYRLINGPEGMQLDPFSGLLQWTPTAGQGQWQDVEIRVDDGRCGQDTQAFHIFLTYLPTVQFEVTPCSGMNPGQEITLTWQTEMADTVVIDQGIGEVATSGSLNITSPDQPTAYTLTAINGAGQVQRIVPNTMSIKSFSADCVSEAGETTLTWETDCALSCWIDQGIGSVPVNGSQLVTPSELPSEYTLTCSNATKTTYRPLVVNRCAASAQIDAAISCCWSAGNPVTLTWSAGEVDACSIAPDVGSVPLSGSMEVFPSNLPTRYTLTCDNASAFVYAENPNKAGLAASATALLPGESTTLYWYTECYDTCRLDQGIGEVPVNGSRVVTPTQLPVTYTLTATCGQFTHTEAITIRPRAPEATFSASPPLIKTGESATLTWTTAQATSCSIQPDIGQVNLNGSIAVTPDQNTIYTLTAIGPGGTITRKATVAYIQPTAAIYADPVTMDAVGQSTTLTWVFSNADTCVIDQGIGAVQLGESLVVSPTRTTTYTITATGPGGVATDNVTVAFPIPTVTFGTDRETLDEGETATLTWTSGNVDTCFIDQGIGYVSPKGSLVVDPERTTTYTITATGPGGTATRQVTLTCLPPTASIQVDPATIIEGQSTTVNWQTAHATTVSMAPLPGQVAVQGTIAMTPDLTTTYTVTASGRGGTATAEATVIVINPPSIGLIEPDGIEDNANTGFTIRWTDRDPDSDAVIALYYDINNSGADGTLIIGGLDENADGLDDRYIWDTSDIPAGDYYVYALIDDGVNAPVVDYSDGPITIDHTVTDEIKLTAGDGTDYDSFGRAVSIDGDYAVVGAPDHDGGGTAYIYRREGAAWSEQIKLTAGDGVTSNGFGTSVSISADTIIVGAPGEHEGQGAVYLFTNDGSAWTRQARLTVADGQAWDNFGACVAVNDNTLVVGAPNHNGDAGAVYLFNGDGSTWGDPVKLIAGNGAAEGLFGAALSIDGELLVVGSPAADNQTGTAFIFRRDGIVWTEEARLLAGDAHVWSKFASSVAISGDTVIVGHSGYAESGVEGAAYFFEYDGSIWIEQAKIGAMDVDAGESFGSDVAVNGDTAVVGEPKVWNGAGAVYLFTRTDDGWFAQDTTDSGEGEGEGEGGELPQESNPSDAFQKLTPGDGQADDYFGAAVAMDAEHVIVGAVMDDDKGYDSGSAYIYPLFSVGIDADPASIVLGEEGAATTLSWSSRGADSVRIDPGIGIVDANGSMTVAPLQTTTYTITGTRNGTTVTADVTVTVIDSTVLPTVTISALPETIARGTSATLSWSATNVTNVTLDNEIGTVPMSGSLVVSPIQATTYSVTAANQGGSVTDNVTVTVIDPPPTVTLSIEPVQINAGEAATLSWTTTHADSVLIDPEIGTVDPSGTLALTPMQTTTYTITATGSGGTATASAAVTVSNPILLQITEPLAGAIISARNVTVRGTIAHAGGLETGLTVNGMPVIIDGDRFTADHVPLVQGENTLTAMATDAEGITLSDAITVNGEIPEDYIRVSATPATGTSPFETTLKIDSSFTIASALISYQGPDDVYFVEEAIDEYQVEIITAGVYTFSVEVMDELGDIYTDEVSVEVIDEVALDALLQDKWAGMKAALMIGDVQKALKYHHEDARERYAVIYSALGDDLPGLVGQMREISPVYLDGSLAKYRILQDHEVSGQTITITYYIYFSKDDHGIWKIKKY